MKVSKILTNLILSILLVSVTLISFNHNVAAQEDGGIPFGISPVIPDNQISDVSNGSDVSYFDLLVKPATKQNISVNISNTSDSVQHFIVDFADATTSDGISVDYVPTNKKLIKSPKISEMLTKNESPSKKITLNPHSKQVVSFELSYPDNPIEGIILGGISVKLDPDYDKSKTKSSGIGITNKFRYSLAIQLRSSLENKVIPSLQFEKVQQTVENYHPILRTTLQNPMPAMIFNVNTKNILKNDKGEVIETNTTELGQIAPISEFDVITPLTKGALKPGKYSIHGEATAYQNKKWTWDKEFTITDENYHVTNENDINKSNPIAMWIWILLAILILLLFLFIFFIIFWKRRKEDKDED